MQLLIQSNDKTAMRKIFSIIASLSLLVTACDDENRHVSLEVTVTLSDELSGYPTVGKTLASLPASGTAYWDYPTVGGDAIPGNYPQDYSDQGEEDNESNHPIESAAIGNKHVYVYLYNALGESSKTTAVLYNGESKDTSSAKRTVKVYNVVPGTYYVIAFYNYAFGDKVTNRLNRYDRYAIYDGTDNDPANVNDITGGNAILDNAATVEIEDGLTTSIKMNINEHYVLGKPRYENLGGQGRLFYTQADYTANGGYPAPN